MSARIENRNNNMGTLHLLSACFVMYGHHCALTGRSAPVVLGTFIQALGVKIIFLISGYLITRSLYQRTDNKRKSSCTYFIKRIVRIWPELLVCLLFSSVIIGNLFTELSTEEYFANPQTGMYVINNLRLFISYSLPGVFANNPYPYAVNGSLWTIPVEIALYILVWIIYVVTNEKNRKLVYCFVTIAIAMAFLARVAFFPEARVVVYTDWIQALNIMPYFMIGGMAYLCSDLVKKYANIQVASVLLLIFGSMYFSTQIANEVSCLLILSYFILSLITEPSQNLKMKYLHSEYAYGMYLYGFVIQQCIIQKLYVEATTPVNSALIYVLSVICAYFIAIISYKCVYVPMNRETRKILKTIEE